MVFPLVFPVMVLGFLKIAAGALIPPAGVALGWVLDPLVTLLLNLLDRLAQLPAANVAVPPAPGWVIIAFYLLLTAIVLHRRVGWTGRIVAGAAVLFAVALAGWWYRAATPDGVRITALAVGRGTATVVELPNGDVWLYDAGASGNYDPGSGVVLPYLHQRGIRHVTGIVLSHPNLDHFGGGAGDRGCDPLRPGLPGARVCDRLRRGFALRRADGLARGPRSSRAAARRRSDPGIGPGGILGNPLAAGGSAAGLVVNDTSLVMRLAWGESSALFTGDIGYFPQERLMQAGLPPSDVLMLPHHGAVEDNTACLHRSRRSRPAGALFVRDHGGQPAAAGGDSGPNRVQHRRRRRGRDRARWARSRRARLRFVREAERVTDDGWSPTAARHAGELLDDHRGTDGSNGLPRVAVQSSAAPLDCPHGQTIRLIPQAK
jgi:hypothetical protein